MSIVLCLNTQLTWKGCGARGSVRPRDKERRPLNRWWSCYRKLLAACTPGFGSWQDHSPSVTLRFSCWLARSRIGHRKKRVLTLGRGNQYPLQGGGPMHVWSAPASRRMFAARCLTTYYYVRGLHIEIAPASTRSTPPTS